MNNKVDYNVPMVMESTEPSKSEGKSPPCTYVVIRGGGVTPEKFQASGDEEAKSRLRKEVRAGQIPIVYCYKLWCAEEFVSSSKTLSVEDLVKVSAKDT